MEIKHSERLFDGYYKIDKLTINTNDNQTIHRELFINKNGVGAIVYNTILNKYILVKQWRIANKKPLIEIVAGSIEYNPTPIQAIKTEILEEIGYTCDKIIPINNFYVSPGAITENVSLFYVEVSNQINNGGGNPLENENIEIIYMTKEELFNTTFFDAKTIIAVNHIKYNNL